MSKITFDQVTTRGGDHGQSVLYDGTRLFKDEPVFELLGELDELSVRLGAVKTLNHVKVNKKLCESLQKRLIDLGGQIACDPIVDSKRFSGLNLIRQSDVKNLEVQEKAILDQVTIPRHFVLAGVNSDSLVVDAARTHARLCERRLVAFIRSTGRRDLYAAQNYLNRLSDLLFVMARQLD